MTCNKWVGKYLSILYKLTKLDNVDKSGFCKEKIKNTLVQQRDYFVQMNVKKEFIKEIDMLTVSSGRWEKFREKNNNKSETVITKIKAKLKSIILN